MKIAVRGGHCPKVTGAVAILNELTEDRKVKDSVIKYLKSLGHSVLDVTPPDSTNTSNADLSYGVSKANEWGADLFVSIHFNKAYNSYNGAIGSEVWVYSNFDIAKRVVDGLGSLGFKNRGQKVSTEFYELNSTKMNAMIVEVCFVEATEDVALYQKLGHDTIGKNIAESISNKKVTASTSNNTSNNLPSDFDPVTYLLLHEDVMRACNNSSTFSAKYHYDTYGKKEGRVYQNDVQYLRGNLDVLKECNKQSSFTAEYHYVTYGKNEGRAYKTNAEFRVKITTDVLNVRKEPSTNSSIVTTVKMNEVYTIVDVSGAWYKLKSGAGWIHSDYCKKI